MNNQSSSGLGISSILTLIFIVLKLVGTIDWSWWWVLAPTWITVSLCLIIYGVIFLMLVRREMIK